MNRQPAVDRQVAHSELGGSHRLCPMRSPSPRPRPTTRRHAASALLALWLLVGTGFLGLAGAPAGGHGVEPARWVEQWLAHLVSGLSGAGNDVHLACDSSWESQGVAHDAHEDERFERVSTQVHEHLAAASSSAGADRSAALGVLSALAPSLAPASASHPSLGAASADAVRPRGPPRA